MNYSKSNCIIISRFNENLDWLIKLIYIYSWIQKIIIFNKGNDNLSDIIKDCHKIHIIKSPNLGREGHTYLSYIIDNYNNLPEYIWFSQADPYDHSPDFIDLLSEDSIEYYIHKEFQSLTWRYDINLPKDITSDKRFLINNNRIIHYYIDSKSQQTVEAHEFFDHMHAGKVNYLNKITPTPYGNYLHYMCGISDIPQPSNIIPYCWSAIFFVQSSSILRNKRTTYIKLKELLLSSDNQGGYQGFVLERLWQYIFTYETYDHIKDLQKSLHWDYSNICACWNSVLGLVTLYNKSYRIHHTTKTLIKQNGYTMIYFKIDSQSYDIQHDSYIDFTPISFFPCLNLETAKLFLQFQIKNYAQIYKSNIMNNIDISKMNNIDISKIFDFHNKKIKFKETYYSDSNNNKYNKKHLKELLYDTLGVSALRKSSDI